MLIRCWGARGSIAVSGERYLKYGGDTTCIEIRTDSDDVVVIDAGSGIRALGNRLVDEDRASLTLLFTHFHWDHILGFPFFKPVYDPKVRIDMYGCPLARQDMQNLLARTMRSPYFPVPFGKLKADIRYEGACAPSMTVGSLTVESISLSHPDMGVGYRFTENGKSFVFLTDNELGHVHDGGASFEEYVDFCRGAELLVHDAEYAGEEYSRMRGWGHSHYSDALELAREAGVSAFGLFHHNQDRSDAEIDAIVGECRKLAAETSGRAPECFGMAQGMEISL